MQDTVVELKSLDGVIAFVGAAGEGTIDSSSNSPRLKGRFRLRLRTLWKEYVSAPIEFGSGGVSAIARAVGVGWSLQRLGVELSNSNPRFAYAALHAVHFSDSRG